MSYTEKDLKKCWDDAQLALKIGVSFKDWLKEHTPNSNGILSADFSDWCNFLDWCNHPIFRAAGELGFRTRVQTQYPDYKTHLVIDETGYSVFPTGKFLTTKELYEYWINSR